MYKLKDIFTLNLNSRGGVKLFNKIANRYNLHKEDRKDLMNVKVGSSESSKGFQWKSAKRFWTIDNEKINESSWDSVRGIIQMIGTYCPIYNSMLLYHNEPYFKLYGYIAQSNLIEYSANNGYRNRTLYFEEAEINIKIYIMDVGEIIPTMENMLLVFGISKEMLEEVGIKQISEEEYLNLNPSAHVGIELVNK